MNDNKSNPVVLILFAFAIGALLALNLWYLKSAADSQARADANYTAIGVKSDAVKVQTDSIQSELRLLRSEVDRIPKVGRGSIGSPGSAAGSSSFGSPSN